MGIPDPILNCVLEICCGAAAAEERFAESLLDQGVCDDKEHALRCARWIFEYFDLAPKGSLTQLKSEIARLARAR